MEGISITNYRQYKQQADAVMQRMAEGFVEVGYILRLAKEQPELLEGSGYRDYKEFAEVEYNLEETTVSRFINMNIKYGDGPKLLPQYQGFGRAKLQDMLSLPGTVIEEIPKETPRTEIQEIKRDYEEEQKVTPIETALEAPQYDDDMTMCQNFFVAFFRANKEEYLKLPKIFRAKLGEMKKLFMECFAPAGSAALRARVPGKGKVMLTIKSADSAPAFTEMRSGERLEYTWDDLLGDITDVDWQEEYGKAGWEEFYGEPWDKTEEIAPVQPASVIANTNTETTYPQEDTGETQRQQTKEEEPRQQDDPFFIVKGLRGKLFSLERALNEGYTRTGGIIEDMIGDLKRLRSICGN